MVAFRLHVAKTSQGILAPLTLLHTSQNMDPSRYDLSQPRFWIPANESEVRLKFNNLVSADTIFQPENSVRFEFSDREGYVGPRFEFLDHEGYLGPLMLIFNPQC